MNRIPSKVAVAIVLATTLISGPLVGSVNLTSRPAAGDSPFCERSGSASVDVVDVDPGSFELRQQDYGARTYVVESDPVQVSVTDVNGCPLLEYVLRIPRLGFFSKRVYFLGADTGDGGMTTPTSGEARNISLKVVKGSFSTASIDKSAYDGTIVIRLLGDANRSIYRTNVTLQVVE